MSFGKGKAVNIPLLLMYARQRKVCCRRIGLVAHGFSAMLTIAKTREYCHDENESKHRNGAIVLR